MSPLLVDWLSYAVLLLTLSLRFPCAVSGRDAACVDRLVCWLALCDRWRSTDRSRFHSVRSSGFGVAGGSLSDRGAQHPLPIFPAVFSAVNAGTIRLY